MLEDLKKIDWGKLTHAYGKATDLPELITKVSSEQQISDEIDPTKTALYSLMNRIFHQGNFYNSTIYVIPFFLELLLDDHTQNKIDVLNVLLSMLYIISEEEDESEFTTEELNELLGVQRTVYQSILRGRKTYSLLSTEKDPQVKKIASELLSTLEKIKIDKPF